MLKLYGGVFRTILLWLLQRWRIFGTPKQCQHCLGVFNSQYHVTSCTGLRHRLISGRPAELLDLESASYLPEASVEHILALTMEQTLYDPDLAILMLTQIDTAIRASLELVFGPRTL